MPEKKEAQEETSKETPQKKAPEKKKLLVFVTSTHLIVGELRRVNSIEECIEALLKEGRASEKFDNEFIVRKGKSPDDLFDDEYDWYVECHTTWR